MPTMKLGRNLVTGLDRYMSSWITEDDPSKGQYIHYVDPSGYPQMFVKNNEDKITFRTGPWNGERFSGTSNLKPNEIYTYDFVMNENEVYYQFNLIDSKVPTRLVLTSNGIVQRRIWVEQQEDWNIYLTGQIDNCDTYNMCGPYGSCTINNSPPCGCFDGFEPKDPVAWSSADWSHGCARRLKLECQKDGFKRISGTKLPDTRKVVYNKSMSLKECERLCHANCSCVAYANSDIRHGGSGCLMWFDELLDIRVYSNGGQDLYVRMNAAELGNGSTRKKIVSILVPISSAGVISLVLWLTLRSRKQKLQRHGTQQSSLKTRKDETPGFQTDELPLFGFSEINKATQHFSFGNKLGEGGFGLVYKGVLNDGQEIAVKRLSKQSKQGIDEFKNEVSCIAKHQHRNLVKLLGCCLEADERMLIYEYMPNKSLDLFIFDRLKSSELLDWATRFNIIKGIARGLSYLHHDSRLRIIHRDLKASNILLDHNLNPKISDFGMARIFGGEESDQANTNRVVGTYGYMAPEYAIDGLFSTKSDVFSFGVLVLEIVSGEKNRGFSHPDHDLNLLGHAWRLHQEDQSSELLDISMKESIDLPQVMRAIHVGLLCVQKSLDLRPSMSVVNLMLGSTMSLPNPKEPGFFIHRNINDPTSSSSLLDPSLNEMSVTIIEAR
ncbi:hypothetical protein RDABS01_032312 [Bienertia sinuspersici]